MCWGGCSGFVPGTPDALSGGQAASDVTTDAPRIHMPAFAVTRHKSMPDGICSSTFASPLSSQHLTIASLAAILSLRFLCSLIHGAVSLSFDKILFRFQIILWPFLFGTRQTERHKGGLSSAWDSMRNLACPLYSSTFRLPSLL